MGEAVSWLLTIAVFLAVLALAVRIIKFDVTFVFVFVLLMMVMLGSWAWDKFREATEAPQRCLSKIEADLGSAIELIESNITDQLYVYSIQVVPCESDNSSGVKANPETLEAAGKKVDELNSRARYLATQSADP